MNRKESVSIEEIKSRFTFCVSNKLERDIPLIRSPKLYKLDDSLKLRFPDRPFILLNEKKMVVSDFRLQNFFSIDRAIELARKKLGSNAKLLALFGPTIYLRPDYYGDILKFIEVITREAPPLLYCKTNVLNTFFFYEKKENHIFFDFRKFIITRINRYPPIDLELISTEEGNDKFEKCEKVSIDVSYRK